MLDLIISEEVKGKFPNVVLGMIKADFKKYITDKKKGCEITI